MRERILNYIKYGAPAFWRKHWGYKIPSGTCYEDYCENLKPIVLKKDRLGRDGEKYVFDLIVKNPSCRVVACNTENFYCEIDIVYLDEFTKEIVFVEVKTRRFNGFDYHPEIFAVDPKRKKKLALAGMMFKDERGFIEYRERYDVAVVLIPYSGAPIMRYYKSFFTYVSAMKGYRSFNFGKNRSKKYLREDLRERQ